MLTIRPSPAGRMAVNAARQQRNEPVRLIPSVCSHISVAGFGERRGGQHRGRADQGGGDARPLGGGEQALHVPGLAHVGGHRGGRAAGPADAPGDVIESFARCGRRGRRGRPRAATASAVAAPIPRLAPVTTATRPASQCPVSGTGLRSGAQPATRRYSRS